MSLDVILRTHDGSSIHTYAPRCINATKAEILRRCAWSLAKSLEPVNHTLTILDDSSSPSTLSFLRSIGNVVSTGGRGNNVSLLEAVDLAKSSTADFVYLVEDDYIHDPKAIVTMLDFMQRAADRGVPFAAIHPHDDPDNYKTSELQPTIIVDGPDRPWRTNLYSTGTVMAHPRVFAEPEWVALATFYETEGNTDIHEGNTINRIWKDRVPLFTPIPSLAVHLNERETVYVDWRSWWRASQIIRLAVGE
jgi:hypothetical protein